MKEMNIFDFCLFQSLLRMNTTRETGRQDDLIYFMACSFDVASTNSVNVTKHRWKGPSYPFCYSSLHLDLFFWWPLGKLTFWWDVHSCYWFFLTDTCFLIIPQRSLLPLKTPIKYEWDFPSSVLTLLSWAPASPIISFHDVKLPSIRSHLICSLPGHPVWQCCVPLAVVAGWDVALSNLLIKAVIRPNPWLWNELLSEPGVAGWNFLIHPLALYVLNLNLISVLTPIMTYFI